MLISWVKVIESPLSTKNPKAGNDLYLTIDADLQDAAYQYAGAGACRHPVTQDSECYEL